MNADIAPTDEGIQPRDRVVRAGSDGSQVGVVESVYEGQRPRRWVAEVRWRRDEPAVPGPLATLLLVYRPAKGRS